jgi:predicted MFS family arabinose efflux permease
MVINTARIIGPALAGLLVTTAGYGWAFLIDAISYIAALTALLLMRPDELFRRARNSRYSGSVRDGVRYIASMPTLWIPLLMLAMIGTLAYNFTVTFPLFITKSLDGSERQYTIIYSVFSCGAIASALFVASRAHTSIRHIIRGAAFMGVALAAFSLVPGIMLALPAAFLIGVASILYTTATTTNFQMEAEQSMHGRVLALQSSVMIGSSAIGGPLLGSLSDVFGARILIDIGAVACFAAALWGHTMYGRYGPTEPGEAPVTVLESKPAHSGSSGGSGS